MNKIYQAATLILLLLSISNCTVQNNKNSEIAVEIQNDSLDTYFSKLYKAKMFNGAVAVKRKGKLIFKKGYGVANLKMQSPFLTSTSLEIASVSKQFTSTAILLLQQEDKLNVNDFAYKYLGEDFPYHEMTISQLLSHTSGIADYEPYFRKNWNPSVIAYNKDILNYFKTQKPKLISPVGEKYHYSNSGYIMLAEIVNAASGSTLEKYLTKKVFQPMQMKSTYFIGRDSIWDKNNYAPGYKWLFDNKAMDISHTQKKMEVMVTLGVPYTEAEVAGGLDNLRKQAISIEESLKNDPDFVKSYEESKQKAAARGEEFVPMNEREIVAMIAYMQRLGTDIKVKK